MYNKFFHFVILLGAVLVLGGCDGNLSQEQEIDYSEDVKPLIESSSERKVRWSCNLIDSQSTCVDFVGEVFTEERMRLSCAEWKFSLDACPYSDLGGCQATPGTISESIIWSYNYGGEPITPEEAWYQAKACNSLPATKWVVPDDFLKKDPS